MIACVIKNMDLNKSTFTIVRKNGDVVEATVLTDKRGFLPRFDSFSKEQHILCDLFTDGKRFFLANPRLDASWLKPVNDPDLVEVAE